VKKFTTPRGFLPLVRSNHSMLKLKHGGYTRTVCS